ncbi:MAG TPA: kelch repeat-containing protein [Acidimicrobiales bacterium]|nr:kelch repeat-containing protein [Acidimicrobiales bacterium]
MRVLRLVAVLAAGAAVLLPIGLSATAGASSIQPAGFTDLHWTLGNPVPNPHLEGTVATVKSNVYDITGGAGDCSDGSGLPATTDVDVYNTTSNSWSSAAAIPNARDEDPVAAVVGKNIYVVGGITGCGGTTVTAVDVYSTKTNTWSTLPAASDLPAAFNGNEHCGAALGKNVYYFDNGDIGVLNTAASPPSWTVLTGYSALSPSSFCSAVKYKTSIVIVGAGDGGPDAFSQRVIVFTPATGAMVVQPETTVPYAEQSVALIKGSVVVVDGDFSPNSVQIVSIKKATVVTASNTPEIRDDAGGAGFVKNVVYVVGGEAGVANRHPHVLIGTPI